MTKEIPRAEPHKNDAGLLSGFHMPEPVRSGLYILGLGGSRAMPDFVE
jgi:hypothetical protein